MAGKTSLGSAVAARYRTLTAACRQDAAIRAMATVQGAELVDVIVDGGESVKSLNRPGLPTGSQ
jgi:hypothetical protein